MRCVAFWGSVMRGIVVGAVLSLIVWVFIGWCGVCLCSWLEGTSFSGTALTLVSSLACIVVASVAGVVWVACLGEDEATTVAEFGIATSE